MKREADQRVISIWLDCYNYLNGTDFQVHSYPDEHIRDRESIDAFCQDSDSRTLAVEHTRIEAFPGEMADNDPFLKVFGKFEGGSTLAEVGIFTGISIEVDAVPRGTSWEALGADLFAFLKQQVLGLGLGSHKLCFSRGTISMSLAVEKRNHLPDRPGVFLVSRRWPGRSNSSTIGKAFEDKLPKLKAFAADRKILLFEQNSVAGAIQSDLEDFFDSNGLPAWMPDIWLLRTAALSSEDYLHLAQIYPCSHELQADWKGGRITSIYR
jgi:hypothetical protein